MRSVVVPSRVVVVENEVRETPEMIEEQVCYIKEFDEENIGKYLLNPVFLDENGDLIQHRNQYTEKTIHANKPIHSIFLSDVPYSTKIDVLYVDESGTVINLVRDLEIQAHRSTKITMTETNWAHLNPGKGRKFLLFVNNRGQNLLADIQAVVNQVKPFITTITQIIELS